jgi:uncharacterized membrane protein (DUF4010 family)
MPLDNGLLIGLSVALGIGLLIGVERERRKGQGPQRGAAGLRTFAVASLAGAVSLAVGGELLLAVTTGGVIALAALSYWRTRGDDPGITTEAALVLTTLLGGLALHQPMLAAGLGAVMAGLLYARSPLHDFVREILTQDDIRDALILAGATLVVLPMLPDRPIGPYDALNPHALWLIVILVMGVSALGYAMIRLVGARFGLPLAGLASGFISSVATIAAMGDRARKMPALLKVAAAGAVLSTVATVVQMTVVVAATSMAVLHELRLSLLYAGIAALGYGGVAALLALGSKPEETRRPERAFSLPVALAFAGIVGAVVLAAAFLKARFGTAGIIVAAAVGGLVDTHASAVSIASLVAAGKMEAREAVLPILVAFSTNTVTKAVAAAAGGRMYLLLVAPGLALVALAAWAGTVLR